ncbi:MAG: MBL fold metallo-hydrolase [Tissierellia bacterium]|nr:MBL fold metallo-hydrolase [Tissierellia bacterium]
MDRLIVLGTGTAIVTRYYNTSFILDNGEGYFLVDGLGGREVLTQFQELNLDWTKLHHAFLTHNHTDHLLGMIWVIRMIAYQMVWGKYDGDFTLFGHQELLDSVRCICKICLQPREFAMMDQRILLVCVMDGESRKIMDYDVTFFDIRSKKDRQFAFALRYGIGKKLVFFGDEPPCESGKSQLLDADWMLAEAFCLYDERHIHTPYDYHHSTVKEPSEIAEAYGVKNLVLWHSEDTTTYGRRKELYSEESKRYYRGNIWVPDDGEIISLDDTANDSNQLGTFNI